MEKGDKLYEGKAKIAFTTDDPEKLIFHFKDDATAFNAQKKGTIVDKGVMNNTISTFIFKMLEDNDVPTHLIEKLNDRDVLVKRVDIVLVEVVVRNIVAGSLSKRTGKDEGEKLPEAIVEYYYKSDELGDPMINDDHIRVFGLATEQQMARIKELALKINGLLKPFFAERNIDLVDFKLEFGVTGDGELILADEICPDTCRLWDSASGEKLDKDRFRRDLGKIEESYAEVVRRVTGEPA